MLLKPFGKTSTHVSALGFGTLRIDQMSMNDACDFMLYAQQKGVQLFDTAPDFANGKSQMCIRDRAYAEAKRRSSRHLYQNSRSSGQNHNGV